MVVSPEDTTSTTSELEEAAQYEDKTRRIRTQI